MLIATGIHSGIPHTVRNLILETGKYVQVGG